MFVDFRVTVGLKIKHQPGNTSYSIACMLEREISHHSCGYLKGVVFNGLDDVLKEDLGGQGVAMVDDRLPICAVPDVQLHTAAAFHKSSVRRFEQSSHVEYVMADRPQEEISGMSCTFSDYI